jgi:hypothetical protein
MADAEVVQHEDIGDISNSPAIGALNELTADGTLTQAQAEFYKSKFLKLHEVAPRNAHSDLLARHPARPLILPPKA